MYCMRFVSKVLLFFLLFYTSNTFGQINAENNKYNDSGVDVTVSIFDCINKSTGIDKSILGIEIINSNDYPVSVLFTKELWYNNICSTCNTNSDENSVKVTIQKQSTLVGNCDSKIKDLIVFVKMLNLDNVRELTNYEFKNIKVEKAK